MVEFSEAGDGDLVRHSCKGDPAAFEELVRRYSRAAYSVALSVTGRHEDAEDAAQESFITALERIDECRNPDRFSGWFLTIVRNRSRNLLRREKLRQGEPIPFGLSSPDAGPERRRGLAELRERLTAAMEELSQVQKEVLLLHDLEGWKHREIAERLGMPSGTVRSHLHYARKHVRALLTSTPVSIPGQEKTG